MGVALDTVDLLNIAFKELDMDFNEMKVCELGDQVLRRCLRKSDGAYKPYGSCKGYIQSLGAEHISLDLNGKHGALKENLSKPIDKWLGYFDLITNYGTIEHVGTAGDMESQYHAFMNVHNFCRAKGVMTQLNPLVGYALTHCPYHYEPWCWHNLAKANNYKMIFNDIMVRSSKSAWNRAVLVKEIDAPFISMSQFIELGGIV